MALDSGQVETIYEAFFTKGKVYVVSDYMFQHGCLDLYWLANARTKLSEAEIGAIAFDVLNELNHLHSKKLYYRYLMPSDIVVT